MQVSVFFKVYQNNTTIVRNAIDTNQYFKHNGLSSLDYNQFRTGTKKGYCFSIYISRVNQIINLIQSYL